MNQALISLRTILYIGEKSPNVAKNSCVFSQDAPNKIPLNHPILNLSRPKVYYGDERQQFYIKSPTLALRPLLYIRKHSKCSNKLEYFPSKIIIKVSIFYQSSCVTPAKIDYSYTRHHHQFR